METLALALHKLEDKVVCGTAEGIFIQSVYIDKDTLGEALLATTQVVMSPQLGWEGFKSELRGMSQPAGL